MSKCDICGSSSADEYSFDIDEIPLIVTSYYCQPCMRKQLRDMPTHIFMCTIIAVCVAIFMHIAMQVLPVWSLE